jgi:hypothetical protein
MTASYSDEQVASCPDLLHGWTALPNFEETSGAPPLAPE